uniref:monocarboxylate transporter 13 n=1 Tax=Myxine glutinosa TaxID=7769 RepID=UPI00358F8456
MLQHQDPPDGGWGWVIVGATFMQFSLFFGVLRSMGVFFVEFGDHFGEPSRRVSWISSTCLCMHQLLSPLASAIANRFGARPVVITGGVLASAGFACACFAQELNHMFLSLGAVTGLGWALVFGPSVSTLSRYFNRRRTLALGVAFTGVGISSFAFSPLFQLLLDKYGWRGALLILAGMELNLCLCGTLLRPITLKEDLMQSKLKAKETSIVQKVVQFFDLSLMTDRIFMLYVLSISFTNFGFFIPIIHLVPHAKLLGHDSYSAAFLLSAASTTDILSRLLCGWLADRYKAHMLYIYVMWAMATGITIALIPVGTTYVSLLIISVFYGFFAGALGPLIFGLIPHIVGIDKVSNAIGLLLMLESFTSLLGPPLSGFLMDKTGSYNVSFVMAGTSVMISALLALFLLTGRNGPCGVCKRGQSSGFFKTSQTRVEGTEPVGPGTRHEIER